MGAFKDFVAPRYELKDAVREVSFNIDKGEIVGYIGPNGAGKSTTIKMMVGILVPTSGLVEIGGPRKQLPRLHGDFMWRQAYNLKSIGIDTAYIAMFDEYDEGTAIAKAAEDASMSPTDHYFLKLDADGVAVSADFYLRLSGDITKLIRGEIPLTEEHPTPKKEEL
jgi:energy-coupling factor transporter ATP-binding protein EcfA2